MRRAVTMLGALFCSVVAQAGGVVVWMGTELPEERHLERADVRTGGTAHLSYLDLAFPPQPYTEGDRKRLMTLRETMTEGQGKWSEFEVEFDIAMALEEALAPVTLLADERDLLDVFEGRLMQGAAVAQAFEPGDFDASARADPFRFDADGRYANSPWLDALALDDDSELRRPDLIDGTAFIHYQKDEPLLINLATAVIDLKERPVGMDLFIDGKQIGPEQHAMLLRVGKHYVHVKRDGVISGRSVIDVKSGERLTIPTLVDLGDLATASDRVHKGTTNGLPPDVKRSLELLHDYYDGPVYVATVVDGRLQVLPYGWNARLLEDRLFTAMSFGELGASMIMSTAFDEGSPDLVPHDSQSQVLGANGGVGFELGIYNFAILFGADLSITPGSSITYGNEKAVRNDRTSFLPQFWGGLGGYVLRPIGAKPFLLFAAYGGWSGPSHVGVGGRGVVGIPVDDGKTWVRISAGGMSFPTSLWDEGDVKTPLTTLFFRVGVGTRL